MNVLQSLLLSIIAAYRKVVSPVLPASCRFYPSCSSYAQEAIGKHGVGRGSLMAVKRLWRCHPWHPGGYDPVEDLHPCDDQRKTVKRDGVLTGTTRS